MPPAIFDSAEQPFLDTLVAGLMRRAGKAPLALAGMTVLLPTRRAARSLREAFLRAGNGAAMLLPRMLPVGDLDPEELALLPDEAEGAGQGFDLPPAVPELRRRLLLTQLVRKYGESNGGTDRAGSGGAAGTRAGALPRRSACRRLRSSEARRARAG